MCVMRKIQPGKEQEEMDKEISGTSRDILLARAKRIDNKEWVEGFYFYMVHEDGRHIHHFIMPLGTDLNLGTPIGNISVEVDPETVCTYIGVDDRNGEKIFTGYILQKTIYGEIMVGEVVWNIISAAGFFLKVIDGDCIHYRPIYPLGRGDEESHCNYLILGNIFDN